MAELRIENHILAEERDRLAILLRWRMDQEADTVPGQPQPGANDASEKPQAPSCPLDLVVDPRSADS